jgi:cytochrome c553
MSMDWRQHVIGAFGAIALVSVAGCQTSDREARSEELYGYCEQCHGALGEGNEAYRVPAIAGLPAWYVEAQVTKFRTGARGDHPDDVDGLRMRPMARTLASPAEIAMVAEYVESLAPVNAVPTLDGDPDRGRALYTPCVQCHGENAAGLRDKGAPPLHQANDWYLVAQLEKFRSGVRGADTADTTGGQMRAQITNLPDEQAMRDVVAYIVSMD